ncbi:F0F1 ATP synthase subunit epsilon [Gleimia sp. 6138-11-ORH1]|uniref:F0F1 ATP synthase subunit epsilon n=1 Tax=Gleimia sp. 6138-11-ORH1 TaxID=2973937 RepID=UPI0021670D9A|nr:F0F1 ATP synthase subunit epsilon [Gleimia sp. 6138-11-ORH1]MCS4484101.1 F0F1 ATP synthase subunit epsilon [Gleimia sp. 6138-11-ORH1]
MTAEQLLKVEIVTRKEILWSGEATHLMLPSVEGDFGVLPKREPIIAVLREGIIRVDSVAEGRLEFDVTGGFVSVDSDYVTVVAEAGAVRNN